MKKYFKVKEKYVCTGWTFIQAETEEEARTKLENGEGGDFDADFADQEWKDTDWDTLREVTK